MTRGTRAKAGAGAAALVAASAALWPGAARAQDPLRLEEVVASALATHPSAAAARARSEAAAAAAGEARSARWPSASVVALATRYEEPMVVAPLHGFDPLNPPAFDRTLVQGHASADWTLYDGGARGGRIRGADRLADAASAAAEAAADAVVAEAVSSYLAVLTARSIGAAYARQVEALASELDRSRQLYDEGRAPRVQVLRAEAALSRVTADGEAAAERLRLAERRLARVSGLPADRVTAAALRAVGVAADPPSRDALVSAALGSSPVLAQAESRAAAAATSVSIARSAWLPRLSLAGRYSAFGSASTDVQPEWNAGVRVSYPVFSGGGRVRAVERAEAEAAAAAADAAMTAREVEDAVDAALSSYRAAAARAAALEVAVAQTAEVARIEALALEAGAGTQPDYLRAEAELLSARAALAEARHAAAEARVRLAQATGELSPASLPELLVEVEP